MTRFAALGDSITLGIGDPAEATGGNNRAWRGWAALLAAGLPEPDLHILAVSGACAADVEREQLPRALAHRPDIASVIFGINDTLRPGFDPELIESAAAHTIGALRATGAQVLTMRLPDAGWMLRLPGPLARPLARRTQQVNAVMDAVSARFGTLHFDAAGMSATYDRRMWAVDRLHPNERGHRLIARSFHSLLVAAGHEVGPAPDAEPASPPPTRLAQVAWMATMGTGWILRRSADLVPHLLALAAGELLGSAGQPRPRRRASRPGAGVAGQPCEQDTQAGDVLLADSGSQPLVKGYGRAAQRHEQLITGLGQLHNVNPAVRRIPAAGDQAGALHRVEVVSQRRLSDADRLSQFTLAGGSGGLHGQQHEPDR
jgi:lysophospholipase L1-like esterase